MLCLRLACRAVATSGVVAMVLLPAAAAQPRAATGYDASRVTWRSASYRVSKFGISVTSDIELQPVALEELQDLALQMREGGVPPPASAELVRLSMHTRAFHRRSELDLWLDPSTATVWQRTQLETGKRLKRYRYRRLRFEPAGVYSLIRRPAPQEVDSPFTQWSRAEESFIPYPSACCSPVLAPAALFYVLSSGPFGEPGSRVELPVLSKSEIFLVELVVEGPATVTTDFQLQSANGERTVKGSRRVVEIVLRGQRTAPGESDRLFEFLGLRGDVHILLDRELRVPLQISGSIRYAGRGHVRLQRLVLR